MLSADQIEAFHEVGFVRVPGALGTDAVTEMRERLWDILRGKGADADDPLTWNPAYVSQLQAIRTDDPAPADNPVFRACVDQLCGPDTWRPPKDWGQALVTFPQTAPWTLPKGPWHLDYPYWFPSDAIWGMNVFLFVAEVEPGGGGTLAVRSSNKLVEKFAQATPDLAGKWSVFAKRFKTRYPWFADLSQPVQGAIRESARIARFMDDDTTIDGVDVRVVELVGDPGDIVLCHPWLVHAWSPNARSQPRLMRAARVWRHDVEAPAGSVKGS